jgi:thymidylate synthase (FAD)
VKIDVLDHGYVRYVKHFGDDLDVINSAKVSYAKETDSFEEKEARLLAFLAREEHTSVFRHSAITFEAYAPLMVARQWWKYAVASSHVDDQLGWNESSRRYITEEPTFYVPRRNEWRSAPENSKQGSGAPLPSLTDEEWMDAGLLDDTYGNVWTRLLQKHCRDSLALYDRALAAGICAEQARLFLPAYGMYVRWRWTASLGAVIHFLHQRLEHDAQKEIQLFSQAVRDLTAVHFPVTVDVTVGKPV